MDAVREEGRIYSWIDDSTERTLVAERCDFIKQ
jgi:hypothetical protein